MDCLANAPETLGQFGDAVSCAASDYGGPQWQSLALYGIILLCGAGLAVIFLILLTRR